MELNEVKEIGLAALYDADRRELLTEAIDATAALLRESWLNADNRRALTGLHFQLRVKLLALLYVEDGYCEEERAALSEELCEMKHFAHESRAERMMALSNRLQVFFDAVGRIMSDAAVQAFRIRDENWNVMTAELREAYEVRDLFACKLAAAEALSDEPPFGDYAFPPVKALLLKDLEEVRAFAEQVVADLEGRGIKRLLEELLTPPSEELEQCEYCPTPSEREHTYAGTVVVCTPFADELELYAWSYGKKTGTGLAIVEAANLNGREPLAIETLFSAVAERGENLLIRGLGAYRGERRELYERILAFGKASGKKAFVMDENGDKRVYNDLMERIRENAELTPMDVAFAFLSMPGYRELTDLLEEKGMLEADGMREAVKKHLPFMGFVGLNRAFAAYAHGRDWLEAGRRISEARYEDAFKYLSCLPTGSLFLNPDWGVLGGDKAQALPSRPEIDYDELRELDPDKLRRIVGGNFTLYEKCGLVCRYTLTHGEDISVWRSLSVEELESRLTRATGLVMRLLGLALEPVVTVHERIPGASATTVGQCVGGGKEIRFKRAALADLTDTIDTICHESFHAFQHMATHTPFCEWYWRELGVTRGRIQTWRENDNCYFSSSEKEFGKSAGAVYRAQVVESEARAFASDCLADSEAAAEKIQWE